MATKYNLEVLHNGTDCGGFCIFQTSDEQMDSIRTLAWFSKAAHPGKSFDWKLEYELFFDADGLSPPTRPCGGAAVYPGCSVVL